MPAEHALDVQFRHRLGTLDLDVQCVVDAPWTVLFGPSGSGKSTILRVIAGLTRPDEGQVRICGQLVMDSATRIFQPPHKRKMRWSAQRAMLFPGKTVRWNIALGGDTRDPEFAGPGWIDELERALDYFDLMHLADRFPSELSGGQRQLVAVVRAVFGSRGRVLLLDEPFSGLDTVLRDPLIAKIRSWHGNLPILSVTHDVGEAFLLADQVLQVEDGHIVAQGPVAEVLANERQRLLHALNAADPLRR